MSVPFSQISSQYRVTSVSHYIYFFGLRTKWYIVLRFLEDEMYNSMTKINQKENNIGRPRQSLKYREQLRYVQGRVKYRSRLLITSNGRSGGGGQPMDVIFPISVAPIDELSEISKKWTLSRGGVGGQKITSNGRYLQP